MQICKVKLNLHTLNVRLVDKLKESNDVIDNIYNKLKIYNVHKKIIIY